MSRAAIVVVNHNTRDDLERCLTSIVAFPGNDVLVVDNASEDGSADMVETRFPEVKLIRATNEGYGTSANHAFSVVDADVVMLLNSDTRLEGDVVRALVAYVDAHPRVAVVGPRLRNTDGSLQRTCNHMPTPLQVLLYETGLSPALARLPIVRRRYLPAWAHDTARQVPWVLGAAIAVRVSAFMEVGGFDPEYFLYWEEVDLCRRLGDNGWDVHFAPIADVTHVGGTSVATRGAEGVTFFVTSLRAFYRKHYRAGRRAGLMLVLSMVFGARLVHGIMCLLLARDPTARQAVKRAQTGFVALLGRPQRSGAADRPPPV